MHVLAALGEQELPLSELAREFDPYAASGEINSSVDGAAGKVADVRASYENDAVIDELDGLSVSNKAGNWWFNLRASNTEELLRLNVEAADAATMAQVRNAVLEQIRR